MSNSVWIEKQFKISKNLLEDPKVWRIWDEALKRYELNKTKDN